MKDDLTGRAKKLVAGAAEEARTYDLRGKVGDLRGQWQGKAEERLETLIQRRRQERGESIPAEVDAALNARRRELEEQAEQRRFESEVLAQARGTEEKRVLLLVLGSRRRGEAPPRYTTLLDHLAAGGEAEREMAIHRALWSLAERRLLSVSPHGEITLV